MELAIGIGVFFSTMLLIYGGYFFVKKEKRPELKQLHQRLKKISTWKRPDILKSRTLSEIPWLNEMLNALSFVNRMKQLLDQAGVHQPLGLFLLVSGLIFGSGIFLAEILRVSVLAAVFPAALLATAPFMYLLHKRKKRREKFERQLPEGLELVARSLRAGHAFTGGLKMVAEEFEDPLGTEFRRTLDEINYGATVPEALTNLTARTDCEDLRFFVVAVIIQRETGGNLAEILENLGRLIKERFKFQGRVRALSAEGRFSAVILVAIPFFVVGVLSLVNPDYVKVLFTDVIGKTLSLITLVMMSLGVYFMRRMVAIKA